MKVLLVIDLQKQFETEASQKTIDYINANRNNYDLVIGTFFNRGNSNFQNMNYSLNATRDDMLVDCDYIIEKDTYSFNIPLFLTTDYEIDIVGCDLDACILATCFSLWDKGYKFNILTNYIYSTMKNCPKDAIISIMKRNFSNYVK